jgi:uncharacterized membrane protein YeaQ/YmgE (transglycosylase-associated protein family)
MTSFEFFWMIVASAMVGLVLSWVMRDTSVLQIIFNVIIGIIGAMLGVMISPLLLATDVGVWVLSGLIAVSLVFLLNCFCYDGLPLAHTAPDPG